MTIEEIRKVAPRRRTYGLTKEKVIKISLMTKKAYLAKYLKAKPLN